MATVRQLCDTRAAVPLLTLGALVAGLWGAAACGGEAAQPKPAGPAADVSTTLPVAPAAGRVIVAEVDGAPVYDDCVAAQVRAHGVDGPDERRAALAACIDFELLAQEAARRGLAAHPEVRRAQKTESVRRFLDEAFAARYPDPSSVDRAQLEAIYRQLQLRYVRPEYRDTGYLRYAAAIADHPEGSPADVAAREYMQRLHAGMAERRDVTFSDLEKIAAEAAGDAPLETGDLQPIHRHDRIVEPYLAATFAIPAVGMVSPPFRTDWGWDIVLLEHIHEALNTPLEEVAGELFLILRRRLYTQWVAELLRPARVHLDQAALSRLQAAEEQARFADVP